ncbi:hypothetical protein PLCT1_02190 [Planctomycetaceae bacterium]|nr:hypothetical protein PLCT1_02190 [Planctomycetaceae bacterium]
MRKRNSATPAPATGLRERVSAVVAEHSQAEVARKTRTPPSTIHRFLRGARIPAEFCGSLVRELGVNPAWLLVGEGAPKLTDVAERTSGMAKDLLSLVAAMNEVAKMRLGSLAGKHHLRVLRELNDALAEFERLRERMDANARPVYGGLLKDFRAVMARGDMDRAEELFKALTQVRKVCHDDELDLEYWELRAHQLHRMGRREDALEMERKVFVAILSNPHSPPASRFTMLANLALGLNAAGQRSEAAAVAAFALRLANTDQELAAHRPAVNMVSAIVAIESGELRDHLGALTESFQSLSQRQRELYSGALLRGLFLAGAVSLDAAPGVGEACPSRLWQWLRLAIWAEDKPALERACEAARATPITTIRTTPALSELAPAVLESLAGRPEALSTIYEKEMLPQAAGADAPRARFERLVQCAQAARLCGKKAASSRHLLEARAELERTPRGIQPDLLELATFHRLARSESQAEENAAKQFFERHLARGYGFLNRWALA